jgi:hypothetical protein
MSYLQKLNRETYEFTHSYAEFGDRGREIKPARILKISENDERSRRTVSSFVPLMDKADSIDCIVDESIGDASVTVQLTNVNTERSAVLKMTYSGVSYSAKVVLGDKQLSVKSGVSKAQEEILGYLNAAPGEKRKTRSIKIISSAEIEEGKYDHLQSRFDE